MVLLYKTQSHQVHLQDGLPENISLYLLYIQFLNTRYRNRTSKNKLI